MHFLTFPTSSPSDKISSHHLPVTNSTQPQTHLSDFPAQEVRNDSYPSRSFSPRLTATIPPHDSPSSTTDNHQTWLPQPPSPRLHSPHTQPEFGQPAQADWVLYPSSKATRPARPQAELPPATSRTAPSFSLGPTHRGQQHQPHRGELTHRHHSVSPVQNPRVRNIIQGTGPKNSSTSPQRFIPTGHFYAYSAPSSSSALPQQRSPSTRPPVPLFHSVSTENVLQQQQTLQNMFTSGDSEGSSEAQPTCTKSEKLIQRFIADQISEMPDFNEFVNDTRNDTHYQDFSFDSPSFETLDASGNTSEPQTISPQELLLDSMSAPPSATLTNLSTPGDSPWESPFFNHSTDTSPAYGQEEIEEDYNFPLFPDGGSLGVNDVFPSPGMKDLKPNSTVAPAMSRNQSSSSQSPFSGCSSSLGRHSSIAGVNARKRSKPLPPVHPGDPNDLVSVKRARNTAAARKSRQKKTQMLEELEEQVVELTNVNVHLQTENTHLKDEAARWRALALARGNGDQA